MTSHLLRASLPGRSQIGTQRVILEFGPWSQEYEKWVMHNRKKSISREVSLPILTEMCKTAGMVHLRWYLSFFTDYRGNPDRV